MARMDIPIRMNKQTFFGRPNLSDFKGRDVVKLQGSLEHMAAQIAQLGPDQVFYLNRKLLDEEPAHRFKKRGPLVSVVAPRPPGFRYTRPAPNRSLELKATKPYTPLQVLEHEFPTLNRFELAGYGWRGEGSDQRFRQVSFSKLLSGAQLFAYESRLAGADVVNYLGTGHATEQGALFFTTVCSASPTGSRYPVQFHGVPIHELATSRRVGSDHMCQGKAWSHMRYAHPHDPERYSFCKHEVAAYFKIAAHAAEVMKNKVPGKLSPFLPPAQVLVDFYKTLLRQGYVLSRVEEQVDPRIINETGRPLGKQKEHYRLMNEAEMEQFLFAYIKQIGVRDAFSTKGGHKLKDRDWS
jgi:hypothetical protein